MKHSITVSEFDIRALKIIRKNVNRLIRKASKDFDDQNIKVLDIAPQNYEGAKTFFKKAIVKTLDINPEAKPDYIADICENNHKLIPNDYFDIVICTEVLEHTLQPFKAVDEIFRIVKNNGNVFISVPYNFRIHGPLPDCWRFTEHGLRALFSKFSIIDLSQINTPGRNLMPIHYTLIAKKVC